MSDNTLTVTEVVNSITVTPVENTVTVSATGLQGPKGDTGATGATGSSGVIAVAAPITNSGTSTSANIGIDLANIALKYASPWQVKYRSGYWYETNVTSAINTTSFTKSRLYLHPLFIQESIIIDRVGVEVTAATSSTTWRIGIYNADSNGVPTTVVLDAGTVDTSSTGLKVITVNQTLSAGVYYVGGVFQGAGSSSPTMRGYSTFSGNWSPVATTTQAGVSKTSCFYRDSVTGALPTFSGELALEVSPARTQFRIA